MLPGGTEYEQDKQLGKPVLPLYVPAGQGLQDDEPADEAKVPAGH